MKFHNHTRIPTQIEPNRFKTFSFPRFSGTHHVFQVQNSYNKINCTSCYIQCGIQDDKSNVILDLILQILREPFFNVLRTQVNKEKHFLKTSCFIFVIFKIQEQQGYMVDCLVRRANGAQGIKFVVETTKNPEYIEKRIASFLLMMEDEITNMSDEKFETSKKALKAKKLPAATLGEQFWNFYREIVIQQYHFNRTNVEATVLKNITKEEVLKFYKVKYSPCEIFHCSQKEFRWLKSKINSFRLTSRQTAKKDVQYRFMFWRNLNSWTVKGIEKVAPKTSSRLKTLMSSKTHCNFTRWCGRKV